MCSGGGGGGGSKPQAAKKAAPKMGANVKTSKVNKGAAEMQVNAEEAAKPIATALTSRKRNRGRRTSGKDSLKMALDVSVANVGGSGRSGLNIPQTRG